MTTLRYTVGSFFYFFKGTIMRTTDFVAGAALLVIGTTAQAGGIERTNQSIDIIFEPGTYSEFSLSLTAPSVSGIDPAMLPTGKLAPGYTGLAAGYKTDIGDSFALAVIADQPYGMAIDYTTGIYTGTQASLQSAAVTVIGSYDISDRIVLLGGATYQSLSLDAKVPLVGGYTLATGPANGFGLIYGIAYQTPDGSSRLSLTYRSAVAATTNTIETFGGPDISGTMDITTPQSVNFEFQTAIAPDTKVFGSARWVNWSSFALTPDTYPGGAILAYTDDRITYSLGVSRELSDKLSARITASYEANLHSAPTPLAPTDGFTSLGIGMAYTTGRTTISGSAEYVWLGNAAGVAGTFENNSAINIGFGISVAM